MIACAASVPPEMPPASLVHDLGDTGHQLVHRQPVTDQTRRADGDFARAGLGSPVAQCRRQLPRRSCVHPGIRPRPVHALAPPELRITARSAPGGQHLLRPQHRRSLDLVAGEHAGRGVLGSLVEHQCQIRLAARLDTGSDAGRAESGGAVTPCVRTSVPRRRARRRLGCVSTARMSVSRCHSYGGESCGLGESEGQIHRLHRGARGALGQIVDRARSPPAAGVGVDGDT